MTERWVVNASPLIVLAKAEHEQLLEWLTDELVVPRPVADEVSAGPRDDRARQLCLQHRWTVVAAPAPSPQLAAWDLGAGETAVLSYAMAHPSWVAILDDGAARRCARAYEIPCKGTLGIVLLAKQHGLIPSARDLLRTLMESGFRLDDDILSIALAAAVGESWPQRRIAVLSVLLSDAQTHAPLYERAAT